MKNVNQLEKERREVLRNMKEEEIIKVYENLTEEYISNFCSFKNNFKTNDERIKVLNNRFIEMDSILKDKYRTDILLSEGLIKALSNELDESTVEIYSMIGYELLLMFNFTYNSFYKDLGLLEFVLNDLYFKYKYKYSFNSNYDLVYYVQDKFNLDIEKEEDLKIIIELGEKASEIQKLNNESNFERIKRNFNSNIKTLVNFIEMDLKEVELYLKADLNEENFIGLNSTFEEIMEIKVKLQGLLDSYEDLKVNPFKKAIEIEVENTVEENEYRKKYNDSLKEDEREFSLKLFNYDEELAKAIANAPKYDFNKFELIEPEEK